MIFDVGKFFNVNFTGNFYEIVQIIITNRLAAIEMDLIFKSNIQIII